MSQKAPFALPDQRTDQSRRPNCVPHLGSPCDLARPKPYWRLTMRIKPNANGSECRTWLLYAPRGSIFVARALATVALARAYLFTWEILRLAMSRAPVGN